MKTVSVTEFRNNLKYYLDIAQKERIVIHKTTGKSFIIIPLEQEKEDFILSDGQKKAIDEAKKNIIDGKVITHNNAIKILRERHPKYFK